MSKREGMKCSLSHMDFDFVLGSRALDACKLQGHGSLRRTVCALLLFFFVVDTLLL